MCIATLCIRTRLGTDTEARQGRVANVAANTTYRMKLSCFLLYLLLAMGTEVFVKLQNTVLTRTFAAGEQLASNVYIASARISRKQELVILQSLLFSTPRTNFLLKIGKIAM